MYRWYCEGVDVAIALGQKDCIAPLCSAPSRLVPKKKKNEKKKKEMVGLIAALLILSHSSLNAL